MTWKYLFLSLILAIVLCMAQAAKAEHAEQFDEPAAGTREKAPITLDPKIINFIETNIPPAKTKDSVFLKQGSFAEAFVEGLQPFLPGSQATEQQKTDGLEKEARVMANLIKMVESDGQPNSQDQWNKLGKALEDEEKVNDIAQVEKALHDLKLTKLVVERSPSNKPEDQPFNAAVQKALDQKEKEDKELADLAKSASEGNEADRKKFQKKLNGPTAANTMAARLNSKNSEVAKTAETEVKAALNDAGGVKFLKFQNGVAMTLKKGDEVASFKNAAPQISERGWTLDSSDTKPSKFFQAGPTGTIQNGADPQANFGEEKKAEEKTKVATNPSEKKESGLSAADKAILKDLNAQVCNNCHTVIWKDGTFFKDNLDLKGTDILSITKAPNMTKEMSKLTGAQKQALKNFAKGSSVADASSLVSR